MLFRSGAAVAEIVANLLENAFRYSEAGQAIGLRVESTDDGVAISVWDHGPEIPEAERQQIFLRGERGSTGRHLAGSGLGLALARELARPPRRRRTARRSARGRPPPRGGRRRAFGGRAGSAGPVASAGFR